MAKSSEKWLWLPDWASDLSLWQDDLTEVDASADHTFVPYETMADHLENLFKMPGLAAADVVVGWGMGAFALLMNHKKKPTKQRWVLLSPYADFCDEDSDWTETNLHFMARQMQTTTEPGLNSFAEQFEEEFGEWQDDWMDCAKKMNAEKLAKGITYLADNKLTEVAENSKDMEVLYGRMDQAVPPAQTLKLKEFLPDADFKERPKAGHWPPQLLL
jgi:pimeloyl-ACP methyl ester carboxylesterase